MLVCSILYTSIDTEEFFIAGEFGRWYVVLGQWYFVVEFGKKKR